MGTPGVGSGLVVPSLPSGGGSSPGLESPETGAAPESSGGSSGSSALPPAPGGIPAPAPPASSLEGDAPESSLGSPAAATFKASENPAPEPWAPLGVGLGSAGLALGGVLFFGRRFGW